LTSIKACPEKSGRARKTETGNWKLKTGEPTNKESELDLSLRARLMLLTVLYECGNLLKYALRLSPEPVNYTLDQLEAAIWTFAVE
jgi:hypothetical protein